MDNPIQGTVKAKNISSLLCYLRAKGFSPLHILIILLPTLLFAVVDSSAIRAYEKKIATHSSRADSLKARISEGENRIKELKEKEVSNLRQFKALDTNITLMESLIDELTTSADSLSRDMEIARTAADSIGVELDKRQRIMEERLRQIYKAGEVTLPAILIGASSPSEVLHRVRYAQDLNRYDREILARINDDQQRRNTEIAILTIQRKYYTDLMTQKSEEYAQLQEQKEKRKVLITSIKEEREQWLAELDQLREAQKELQNVVLDLIKKRDEASEALAKKLNYSFEKRKGKMLWPISGEIVSHYGPQIHPIHKTKITNKGIGIAAASGTIVKAVAPGIVEYTGKLPGYGKVLIINHYGGYMTIYAHLGKTDAKKGTEIQAGTVLGSVGVSTSLEGSSLHFEIRNGAKTLNPTDWLSKRKI